MATARLNLNTTREYNAFQLVMDTNHALDDPDNGIVARGGCPTGWTLVLGQIIAVGDDDDDVITYPTISNCITWQSSDASCSYLTPARNQTWGQIRSLHR